MTYIFGGFMKTLFNDGWQFFEVPLSSSQMEKDGKPVLLEPADFYDGFEKLNPVDFKALNVPHDWMITDTRDLYRSSVGYYKKIFELGDVAGKHFAVNFEGVYMNSAVFVNGKLAGNWKYGYSAFEFDISALVKTGINEIVVICVYQSPNTRWYSGAGIFRDVTFIETENNFIVSDGTYIRVRKISDGGEGKSGKWQVKIRTEAAIESDVEKYEIRHTLFEVPTLEQKQKAFAISGHADVLGDSLRGINTEFSPLEFLSEEENKEFTNVVCGVAGRKIAVSECVFEINNPKLWDTENPTLYFMSTELVRKNSGLFGSALDSVLEHTAFRTIEYSNDEGFFLNGKHTKIYGVCQHHDLGGLGSAFNKNVLKRQLIRLKEMGVNGIRTSHNPVTKDFFDLCDEMGFLVDNDGFDMWEKPKTTYDYGNYFNDWCERDCASWVRKDRNHPCLIMWSIGNEIYDTHIGNGFEITKRLSKYVRAWDFDSNAPTTIASNYMMTDGAQNCAEETDVVGYNYLERLYDEHHKKYPHWKIYGSETSSTIQSRGIYHFPLSLNLVTHDDRQCSTLGNCTTTWGCESTQKVITNDRDAPFSAGQFIWTGWEYIGEPTPYNNTSKSSYFGQIDTAGFPKDTFFLYKAEWGGKSFAPFVHVLPYWDWNEGQIIPVKAYTNCSDVELFLNGKSFGKKYIDHEKNYDLFGLWQVPFEKGELKVVAYDENGNDVCEEIKHSFTDPVKISLEPEYFENGNISVDMSSDGEKCHIGNMYFFDIMTLDKDGYDVLNARNVITVNVEGDAEFVSMDNGDATDYDQYISKTRRLFGNRLVAIVRAKSEKADFTVTAVSKDLAGVECRIVNGDIVSKSEIDSKTSEVILKDAGEYASYVPVRKIEIVPEKIPNQVRNDSGMFCLTKENSTMKVVAKIYPENATCKEITFAPMLPESVLSDAVEVIQNGTNAELKAVCDGKFILRATANNGYDYPEIISECSMEVCGVGNPKFNPYKLVEACRYTNFDRTREEPKLAFTGGISTRGSGNNFWVSFDKVDFGVEGSDEISVPAFCWDASWPIEVWDGEPGNGECVLKADFEAEYQYNTYTEKSFTLTKRLFGVHKISVLVGIELVWHGFRFTKSAKAFGKLRALDADTIVGDTFKKTSDAVEGIGNNVNLDFKNMNFWKTDTVGDGKCVECAATKITICGKSNKPNNSINLKWFGENGTTSTQVIEFPHTDAYEEKTFAIEQINGKGQISFVFLPGCDFDFKWFRFLPD